MDRLPMLLPLPPNRVRRNYRGGLLFLCQHMCFDLRKAREQLGYVPRYEPEESIPQTVKWMFDEGIITKR